MKKDHYKIEIIIIGLIIVYAIVVIHCLLSLVGAI